MKNMDTRQLLVDAGMKEKDACRLIRIAFRKKVPVSRMFFIYTWKYYAWKYYAWIAALFIGLLFACAGQDIAFFVGAFLLCFFMALFSLFFTPFFKNVILCVKIQWKIRNR